MTIEHKIIGGIGIITLVILIGGIFFLTKSNTSSSSVPQADIVSQNGLHWHPKLSIYINGKKQALEDKIGLGAVHQPLHTHIKDYRDGVVHMEFEGQVAKNDTKLGNFFKIWGKEFNATQIFDKKNSDEGTVRMTINGEENTEFENYLMKDHDQIKIEFE